ncbi:MAG: putative LPS assembly protein LptD, partial [Bacteroidales bacterium]|nr:putative LPS assembly protein LptD [Bacteroidales bacterium]
FGKHHRIQAIRHVISPSVSFSWSPEKGTYANGYRTLNYVDAAGNDKVYQYNIYSGQLNSPPSPGQSGAVSLSIGNNLEAKVRDFADTTGTGSKKVKLIDQLTLSTSYNFLADSLRMSTIQMSMSTTLFNAVSISASASFDPYAISDMGTRYNRFAIAAGQGLARLTTFSASASYSLAGKGAMNGYDGTGQNGRGSSAADYYQRIYYHPVTGEYIPEGWIYYTNPNVPWSLNLSASFSMSRMYSWDRELNKLTHKNSISATLSASGNIKLTPKMSINLSSGYDFVAKQLTTTSISASYDLHCFNIAVSWIPTGKWKSYSFRIAANAAALADLLRFKRSNSYWDN